MCHLQLRRSGALIGEVNLETLMTDDSCRLFSLHSRMKLCRLPHRRQEDLVAQQHWAHHTCTHTSKKSDMFSLTGAKDVANVDNAEDVKVCGNVRGFPADYENKQLQLDSFGNPRTPSVFRGEAESLSFTELCRLTCLLNYCPVQADFDRQTAANWTIDLQRSIATTPPTTLRLDRFNCARETVTAAHLVRGWSSTQGCTPQTCFHCRGTEWKRPELG